jgi:hypothetical protein
MVIIEIILEEGEGFSSPSQAYSLEVLSAKR